MSRPRLTIGTYGEVTTRRLPSGRVEARTRYRDWDGIARLVQARAETVCLADSSQVSTKSAWTPENASAA